MALLQQVDKPSSFIDSAVVDQHHLPLDLVLGSLFIGDVFDSSHKSLFQVVQDGAFEHGYQQYLVNVPIQQLSDARSHVRRVSGHLAQVQSQNGGDEGVGGRAIELQQQLHMLSTDAEESRLHPLGRQLTVLFLPDMST